MPAGYAKRPHRHGVTVFFAGSGTVAHNPAPWDPMQSESCSV